MSKIIGQVISSSPNNIQVLVETLQNLEDNKDKLQVGNYLKIADGNSKFTIATIKNLKALDYNFLENDLKLIIECHPIGSFDDERFIRGNSLLPVPTEPVYIADEGILDKIFKTNDIFNHPFGVLKQNNNIQIKINGDNFFSKHIAIVGSTGSGKSSTVARIIQDIVGISESKNLHKVQQKNSHILIFDIHSEYASAFKLNNEESFTLNNLLIENLKLPYWLMNSEELESIFIESNENNSHNQVSIFKYAVIKNKEKYNPTINNITYDTPVYFNISEVYNYIENINREVISKLDGENYPKLSDNTLVTNRLDFYFDEVHEFIPQSQSKDNKASNGPFYGEFNRFVSRLETKLSDKRLNFLLDPRKDNGDQFKSEDFNDILKQFLGYLTKANISIVDLSGIPFEVLSITVSLISRLIFDFSFYYSKLRHKNNLLNDVPFLIVCEEAHNYIPRSNNAEYNASKKSLERIAKEGRKYGLSLMVVSQRPSEVSETILAQCNNFISLRLTNYNDQNYIKNLMPDSNESIKEILPNLSPGESIIVGDAVIMPTIVKLNEPNPKPKSESIKFKTIWENDWIDLNFEELIKKWRNEMK